MQVLQPYLQAAGPAAHPPSLRTRAFCVDSPRPSRKSPFERGNKSLRSHASYPPSAATTPALDCANSACSFASFTSLNAAGTSLRKKSIMPGNCSRAISVKMRGGFFRLVRACRSSAGIWRSRAVKCREPYLRRCEVASHQQKCRVAQHRRIEIRILLPALAASAVQKRASAQSTAASRDHPAPSATSLRCRSASSRFTYVS